MSYSLLYTYTYIYLYKRDSGVCMLASCKEEPRPRFQNMVWNDAKDPYRLSKHTRPIYMSIYANRWNDASLREFLTGLLPSRSSRLFESHPEMTLGIRKGYEKIFFGCKALKLFVFLSSHFHIWVFPKIGYIPPNHPL